MSARLDIVRAAVGDPAPEGFDDLVPRPDTDPSEGTVRWVARRQSRPVARLSAQTRDDLHGVQAPSGLVGHYEALDSEAGIALLRAARDDLVAAGAVRVLGPMNGSTWRRYRLALPDEPGDSSFDPPWFLGEPRNPFEYAAHFEAAGFAVAARYESRIEPSVRADVGALGAGTERLSKAGLRIRPLDPTRFDVELRSLFELSLTAFANNLLYTPIPFEEFRAMYERLRSILDPSLVLLAEDRSGTLAGYLFAYPDLLSDRGSGPTRAVAKTVATAPTARRVGLGAALLDAVCAAAARRGLGAMIHALMHVRNASMRMSARHASQIFRRYALYGWPP